MRTTSSTLTFGQALRHFWGQIRSFQAYAILHCFLRHMVHSSLCGVWDKFKHPNKKWLGAIGSSSSWEDVSSKCSLLRLKQSEGFQREARKVLFNNFLFWLVFWLSWAVKYPFNSFLRDFVNYGIEVKQATIVNQFHVGTSKCGIYQMRWLLVHISTSRRLLA